ncbi:MFS transporter [Brevibacillus sp. B_LB10_24]|uniref:MFS transporter n=1 Tax=Brevibacillus sp. B_LB10_24 TaxID=3380645 RepID=UPI0038BAC56B
MRNQGAGKAGQATPPLKVAIASVIGNTIEYYDFLIYGTLTALVFNQLFFPGFNSQTGTLLAFATFAIGFFSRPLGGVIFGHFGDRLGRKKMLVLTLLIMGTSTFLIGLLPTYSSIGIWAPLLLVILRFTQGLSAGGEWGGAVLMAVEHAPENRRGFFGSLVQMGSPLGIILSSGVTSVLLALLTKEQFLSWGWRIPFLVSVALLLVGLFIRLKVLESPAFAQIKAENTEARLPILEVLRNYPKNLLIAVGLHIGSAAFGFLVGVFIISYATNQLGLSSTFVLNSTLISGFAYLFITPVSGWLSDRFGRRPVYIAGAISMLLFAFPFFWLIDTGMPSLFILALLLSQIIIGLMFGVQAAFYSELFGARVRYSGVSLGFQAATVLGGGLMPNIASLLLGWSNGGTWVISAYIFLLAAITVVAAFSAKKTHG